MKIGNRQQILGFIAIAAVILLAGDRLLFTPLVASWKQRAARIVDLKKSVSQGLALLERESIIQERWDGMRTNILASEVSVAENQVLRAFERWTQESRASLSSIKPQVKRSSSDDYSLLECRVDATGSLPVLARFLYEIEQDPLAMKVDSVTLTSRDESGQQLTLNLQVSGLLLNATNP